MKWKIPTKAKWYSLYEEDKDFRLWFDKISRDSPTTAIDRARVLNRFMGLQGWSLDELTDRIKADRDRFEKLLISFVGQQEKAGYAPGTIKNYIKSVKSWANWNGVKFVRQIKISNRNSTPTLDAEKIPTESHVQDIRNSATPRGKICVGAMAYGGLRPETLGRLHIKDGLKLGDLSELDFRTLRARMMLNHIIIKKIFRKVKFGIDITMYIFRKLFKVSMMSPALADNIIHGIYNCRKLYLLTYFFLMFISNVMGVMFSSYLASWVGDGQVLSSYPLSVNFFFHSQIIMLNLLKFTNSQTLRNYSDDYDKAYKIEDLGGDGPRIAAYTRVSSKKQANEGVSLEVQRDEIEDMKRRFSPSKIYWFEDAGKTGTTFQDREIKHIQELAESGNINELWVTEIDRLGRDCRKLLIYCLKLCEDGVIIRTPNRAYQLSDLAGLLSLFLQAHGAEEENRKRAERAVASKARNFKMKQWNKPVPLGYEIENNWIVKKQDWTQMIIDVYRLFLVHKKIRRVCLEINKKYRVLIGAHELTTYRIKRFLTDTVYIGKPEHIGQVVVDASLRYIDEELFSKVQLILESIRTRHMRKGDDLKELVDMYGISVFSFLNKIELHHSKCGGKLVRNGTRIIDGIKRFTYLCKNCREQFWVPSKSQLSHINNVKQKNSIIQTRKNASNNDCVRAQDNNLKSLINSQLPDFFNKV